jgi:hypothetical protein
MSKGGLLEPLEHYVQSARARLKTAKIIPKHLRGTLKKKGKMGWLATIQIPDTTTAHKRICMRKKAISIYGGIKATL